MRNSAAGTGKKAAGASAGKTGAAADAGRDEAIRHWYKGENRDTIIYLLIAIFFLELIIGGIAFFLRHHARQAVAGGGPPEAQFPILAWAIGAVAAPVALLLIVHLSGLWVSNTLERERQPGKPGSEHMVPKRLRYFYACVQHAPTVVILLGILLLAAALVFVDGMFSAVVAFGAAPQALHPVDRGQHRGPAGGLLSEAPAAHLPPPPHGAGIAPTGARCWKRPASCW